MKCPHCNQDHPEGTKFCPETGERIVNKEVHNAPSSIKSWSTQQDFDRGDIIVDGVILGKTNLSELRKRGCDIDTLDYETGRESNVYSVYLGNGGRIIGLVSRLTYKDLEQKSEGRKNPLAFNKEALLNLYSKVVSFGIKLGKKTFCCKLLGSKIKVVEVTMMILCSIIARLLIILKNMVICELRVLWSKIWVIVCSLFTISPIATVIMCSLL